MPHVMTLRVAAAQAAVDAYKDKPFIWGRYDCARLAAFTLKRLGYKPGIARAGFYKSPLSAAKALERLGFADLGDVMDEIGLPRIGQASALPGDILGFGHPDQPLRVGLAIAVGNGRILAFLEDKICHVVSATYGVADCEYLAWRAHPCPSS